MEMWALIISILSLIATGIATFFTGYQVYQSNQQNKISIERTKEVYIQKIKLNHKYIKKNLNRFKNTLILVSRGSTIKEQSKSLHSLGYFITSICNKKFEDVIKEQIEFTEDYIRINTTNTKIEAKELLNAHKYLVEVYTLIKNSNYLISLFFPIDFDDALKEDIENIHHFASKNKSFRLDSEKNVLYSPPGNLNILGYATPLMYYGHYVSNLIKEYGIKPEGPGSILDIPLITINNFGEKGDYQTLMTSIDILTIINLLDKIISNVDNLIDDK